MLPKPHRTPARSLPEPPPEVSPNLRRGRRQQKRWWVERSRRPLADVQPTFARPSRLRGEPATGRLPVQCNDSCRAPGTDRQGGARGNRGEPTPAGRRLDRWPGESASRRRLGSRRRRATPRQAWPRRVARSREARRSDPTIEPGSRAHAVASRRAPLQASRLSVSPTCRPERTATRRCHPVISRTHPKGRRRTLSPARERAG